MKIESTINSRRLREFQASMVYYTVGPCEFDDTYIATSSRIIPVMLKSRVTLRTITMTLDFEGKTPNEIARNISKMTAMLFGEVHLVLPDGFHYWCAYVNQSTPELKAPLISQVKFTFAGFRHLPVETVRITSSCSIFVDGNVETPAIITITPAEGTTEVSFNGVEITDMSCAVTIDGVYTTVLGEDGLNKYRYTNMTEWPKLQPGENVIEVSGAAVFDLSYYPIFQ